MIFGLFKRRSTAPVARERLQVLLAHERALLGRSDLLGTLREEILAVIARHVHIDPDKVRVEAGQPQRLSTLKVDIEIPVDGGRLAA